MIQELTNFINNKNIKVESFNNYAKISLIFDFNQNDLDFLETLAKNNGYVLDLPTNKLDENNKIIPLTENKINLLKIDLF